jgi:glycosyltransferase involved in cell wall biosynthesis
MNVIFYACETFASGHIRGIVPAAQLNRRGRVRVSVKTDVLYCDWPGTDAMVFQRQHKPVMVEKIAEARRAGIATLYDLDDDLFGFADQLELLGAEVQERHKDYADQVRACIREADCVVCSTKPLEELVRAEVPDARATVVIENGLDLVDGNWEPCRADRIRRKARPADDTVTVGWYGSMLHTKDAPDVGPALAGLMAKHPQLRLHFIGHVNTDDLGVDLKQHADRITNDAAWHDISALPHAISGFDIGLAVQSNTRFNAARSNIKWQEMAALEIPAVASDMPAFRGTITNGLDGFVCRDQQEWFAALDALIEDPALRERVGRNARKTLENRFCMAVQAPKWERMYRHLLNHLALSG